MSRQPMVRSLGLAVMLLVAAAGPGQAGEPSMSPVPTGPSTRSAEPSMSPIDLTASVEVLDTTLAVTHAHADSLQEGLRFVRVRIVDDLDLRIDLRSAAGVDLAAPPRLCLVGPYPAPDDAGLEDRCWGTPDLATLPGELLMSGFGPFSLAAGETWRLEAPLSRGTVRCDYPAGTWTLEMTVTPLLDGIAPGEPVRLAPFSFEVPWDVPGRMPELAVDETRYCGLASLVVQEQGEPPTPAP